VLLAVALATIDLAALAGLFRNARPLPFLQALLLLALGGCAGALSWHAALRTVLPDLPFRRTFALHWTGMFFNTFLPSNLGGDVVKGLLATRDGHAGQSVTAGILVDRLANMGLLVLIGVVSYLLHLGHPLPAGALLAGALLLPLLLPAAARGILRAARPAATPVGRLCRELLRSTTSVRACGLLFGAASVSQLCKIGMHVLLIRALGIDLPESAVWFVVPLFGLVSALPISVGGLGVRECFAQQIAAPLGFGLLPLTTLSLAGHLAVVIVNLFGLIPYLLNRHAHSS